MGREAAELLGSCSVSPDRTHACTADQQVHSWALPGLCNAAHSHARPRGLPPVGTQRKYMFH